ncbi:MAG: hypothetical protein LBH30_03455 [Prevotellaceae bacterium]|jgi:hypothetical protein|nr:hypothetical protein [Prevotellaceae bacterium]
MNKLNKTYMHEYGHYLDSRRNGLGYLTNIGIPSLLSANRDKRHGTNYHYNYWAEKRANRYTKKYFGKYYGVDWNSPYPYYYSTTTIEDFYPTK